MKPSKIEFEVAGENPTTFEEQMFNVRCTVAPGSPGKLSGPPEDCYPAEPCEVDSIQVFRAVESSDPNYKVEVPEAQWPSVGLDREMLEELAQEKAQEYWQGLKEDADERRGERD